jgi:hypothetical protein
VEATKFNSSLEKLWIQNNTVSSKLIDEISTKTSLNETELKRQKMPEYKQELIKIDINTNRINDLEVETQLIIQEQISVQKEIQEDKENFKEIIATEDNKYNRLVIEYDETVADIDMIEKQIEECDAVYKEEFLRTQSSLLEATHRIKSLDVSIDNLLSTSKEFM